MTHESKGPVYRIDKFAVPAESMDRFMDRVEFTRRALAALPGCGQNLVLRQTGGPGRFNVVTIVEWASEEAIASAHAVMQRHYAEEGFDPAAFIRSLDVEADLALYQAVSRSWRPARPPDRSAAAG